MNFLFTSSGRRVELLKLAKKSLMKDGGGSVVAADMDVCAPTSKFCDKFIKIPSISDSAFIPSLLDICRREKIDVLIPTIDTELEPISANLDELKKLGVLVNISHPEVVAICRDKLKTQKFFDSNGIGTPRRFSLSDLPKQSDYPLFIKPRNGSSSVNVFKLDSERDFLFFREYVPNPIVQKFIDGVEYTVDAFCDFDSNPITVVPRRRIAVRGGEIQRGRVEKNRRVIDASIKLLRVLKPFGHITIQCIENGGEIFFTEINPRFGGGAPMSISSGADSFENLIKAKRGEKLEYNENWRDNLVFSRFDDSVIVG